MHFSTLYTSLPHDLLARVFNASGNSFIATNNFHTFWTDYRKSTKYTFFPCKELCFAIDFLIENIYVRFGNSVFRQVVGIPMGTNSAPLLADLFLHTYEYDFMLTTKQDMTKAVSFGNTFPYIDDLFSVNNEGFGDYISYLPVGTGIEGNHHSIEFFRYILGHFFSACYAGYTFSRKNRISTMSSISAFEV